MTSSASAPAWTSAHLVRPELDEPLLAERPGAAEVALLDDRQVGHAAGVIRSLRRPSSRSPAGTTTGCALMISLAFNSVPPLASWIPRGPPGPDTGRAHQVARHAAEHREGPAAVGRGDEQVGAGVGGPSADLRTGQAFEHHGLGARDARRPRVQPAALPELMSAGETAGSPSIVSNISGFGVTWTMLSRPHGAQTSRTCSRVRSDSGDSSMQQATWPKAGRGFAGRVMPEP